MKIHDHDEINQHNGEQDSCANTGERFVHALHLSAHIQKRPARQILFCLIDNLVDLTGHAAEVAPLHIGHDIENRLDVVMIHNHRRLTALDRSEIT